MSFRPQFTSYKRRAGGHFPISANLFISIRNSASTALFVVEDALPRISRCVLQSWSISDKRSRGSIVRFIWLSTIPNSRHALCGRRFFHAVSPGGNRFRMGNQLLRKQRHEKLAVEPRLSAFIIVLWEMANCAIDLNLLKTSSTGHRSRYHCKHVRC